MSQNQNLLQKPTSQVKQSLSRRQINKKFAQISNNLSELFRQNSYKFQAYLSLNSSQKQQLKNSKQSTQQLQNLPLKLSQKLLQKRSNKFPILQKNNLQIYQCYQILQEGVYILMNGMVKIVTFNQDNCLGKGVTKEYTQQVFRRLRYNKQIGVKNTQKSQGNPESSIKKILKHNRNNSNSAYSTPSNNLHHNNSQNIFNVSTISSQFFLFHSINQNCLVFSNNTILYKLQEEQLKKFKFISNKQNIDYIFAQNIKQIKNHSLLYHTVQQKSINFHNFLNIQNIAIIKKGLVKVWGRIYLKLNDQTQNNDRKKIKQTNKQNINQTKSMLTSKYAVKNFKQTYKRVLVCELGSGNIIIKGNFQYQVISANVQILVIKANQTFQMKKQPQWVQSFKEKQKEIIMEMLKQNRQQNKKQENRQNKIENQGKYKNQQKFKQNKQVRMKTFSKGFYPNIVQHTNQQQKNKQIPKQEYLMSKSGNFNDILKNNQNEQLNHNIARLTFMNKYNSRKQTKSTKIADQILNYQQQFGPSPTSFLPKNFTTIQTKERLFFKVMSPYIIVSQKIGLKQMKQTRKKLKQKVKNLNLNFKQRQQQKILETEEVNIINKSNEHKNQVNQENRNKKTISNKLKNHKLLNIIKKHNTFHSQQQSLQDPCFNKSKYRCFMNKQYQSSKFNISRINKNLQSSKDKQNNSQSYFDIIKNLRTSNNKYINYQTVALKVPNQNKKNSISVQNSIIIDISPQKIDLLNRQKKNIVQLLTNYKKGRSNHQNNCNQKNLKYFATLSSYQQSNAKQK